MGRVTVTPLVHGIPKDDCIANVESTMPTVLGVLGHCTHLAIYKLKDVHGIKADDNGVTFLMKFER